MSLKKCQTEMYEQIVENGAFCRMSYDALWSGLPYVGAVECEGLPSKQYFKFGVKLCSREEQRKIVERCAIEEAIPKICKKCTKCGEAI